MPISNTPVAPNLTHSPPLAGYNVLSGAVDRPQSIAPVRQAGIVMLDANGVLVDGAGNRIYTENSLIDYSLGAVIKTQDGTANDTTYTELANFTLPANLLGTNGILFIDTFWLASSVTQTKDLNVLVGGSSIGTPSMGSSALTAGSKLALFANGANNAQIFMNNGIQIFTTGTNAPVLRSLDSTGPLSVSIQMKWSADPGAAATCTLLNWTASLRRSR